MTFLIKVGVIFTFSLYFRIALVLTHPTQMTLYCEEFYCFWLKNEKPLGLDGLKEKKMCFCILLSDRITYLSKPQLLVFSGSHRLQRIDV